MGLTRRPNGGSLDALSGGSLMAEPPAAALSGVAASRQVVLLATKLHVPGPLPGFVPRPRLVEALSEGLAQRLILVCAPAGSGKTALLADWARRNDRLVAWLSLDTADNDPARFWRHVVAALDRVRPGIGERAGPLLGPPAPSSFEGLVATLINELAAQPGADEVLLVLDDYQLIDAQQVHMSLAFLLGHLPPGLHLVLASRSDPPLPLARLRAGGQLAELRAGDLRFTAAESAALLREATGAELPGTTVAALAARTEGWAAGLQLAGLSLRGRRMSPGLWRPSAAATVSSWTTWPRRCWSSRASRCAPSCWRPRCWSGCQESCVTRSPAVPAARRCWTRWSGRTCS
jgi:ATP/maltotriose-dependent transcriptional regulator MalT